MKIKNIKVIPLSLILIMATLFSSGCKEQNPTGEPGCNHEYGEWQIMSGEYCNERAYSQVCSRCGDTKSKQGSESDHSWQLVKTVPVTCGEDGYSERACSLCNKTEIYDVVPKHNNHSWTDPATLSEPTCGENGFSVLICYVCNEKEFVISPATGNHTIGSEGVCTTCGNGNNWQE